MQSTSEDAPSAHGAPLAGAVAGDDSDAAASAATPAAPTTAAAAAGASEQTNSSSTAAAGSAGLGAAEAAAAPPGATAEPAPPAAGTAEPPAAPALAPALAGAALAELELAGGMLTIMMCSISRPERSARKPPSATLRLPQRTTSFSCTSRCLAAAAAPLALEVLAVLMRMRMRGGSSKEPREATSRSRRPSTPAAQKGGEYGRSHAAKQYANNSHGNVTKSHWRGTSRESGHDCWQGTCSSLCVAESS